jgi:predicted nuclease of predicted toxin-antitoxin system
VWLSCKGWLRSHSLVDGWRCPNNRSFNNTWAKEKGYIIFTHDLDFGTILAVTKAEGPSVIQVREHDVLPESMGSIVVQALSQFESHLQAGALITIDSKSLRARILPIT